MGLTANEIWARKLQWSPGIFGSVSACFSKSQLNEVVREFQREHDLVVDGVCGPKTFRVWLESHRFMWDDAIIFNGVPASIDLPPGVTLINPWHMFYNGNTEYLFTMGDRGFRDRRAYPSGIVIHNALCFDIQNALNVFDVTKYIPHFCIGDDGLEVYQLFDPVRYCTFHVGARDGAFNETCIGIDNVNILETKHVGHKKNTHRNIGSFYLKKDMRLRHREFLRLHYQQVETCRYLIEGLCGELGRGVRYPSINTLYGDVVLGDIYNVSTEDPGVVAHGMIQSNRWDGLDWFYEMYVNNLLS